MMQPLTIWTNYHFPPSADTILVSGTTGHRLVRSTNIQKSNLVAGAHDPAMEQADVALGQPDPAAVVACPRVKWVHLSSAGYDRYDTPEFRAAMQARGGMLTTSSHVYEEPCAEHVFAMMLSLARQLPQAQDTQRGDRSWPAAKRRIDSVLLINQTVVILGFGVIAQRLVQLLSPFNMRVIAVRRSVRGDEGIETVAESDLARVLPRADHVVNILPGGAVTRHFINRDRLAVMKPDSIFYNIGRGTTVDQSALLAALDQGPLRFAYLDVTDPEPLPAEHPLWSHPKCLITPHTAGGAIDEFDRLAQHFVANLNRLITGEPLRNRVI